MTNRYTGYNPCSDAEKRDIETSIEAMTAIIPDLVFNIDSDPDGTMYVKVSLVRMEARFTGELEIGKLTRDNIMVPGLFSGMCEKIIADIFVKIHKHITEQKGKP